MWSVKTLPKARSLSLGFFLPLVVFVILIASAIVFPLTLSSPDRRRTEPCEGAPAVNQKMIGSR